MVTDYAITVPRVDDGDERCPFEWEGQCNLKYKCRDIQWTVDPLNCTGAGTGDCALIKLRLVVDLAEE